VNLAYGERYNGSMFAGDGERERAAATLRENYVRGRLTLDELVSRSEQVVGARSRAELRAALSGLPLFPDARELAAQGRRLAQVTLRGATLVIVTGAYLGFCSALLLVLGLTLLIHGVSGSVLAGFLVVWLIPTYLLSRLWHRKR
jgi:hypothetical protein